VETCTPADDRGVVVRLFVCDVVVSRTESAIIETTVGRLLFSCVSTFTNVMVGVGEARSGADFFFGLIASS
jgi:hypothetical protein